MKLRFACLIHLCALFALSGAASAGQSPTDLLRERDQSTRSYLSQHPLPLDGKQRAHIEEQLNSLFDFEYIALESVAAYKAKATPQQIKEYVDTFSRTTRRSSSSEEALKNLLQGKIKYLGEEKTAKGFTLVKTVLVKKNEEISVDYVFRQDKNGWRIVNYVLDDVDLIDNYRGSFGKIITDKGFAELIRRLKSKLSDA